ncbi:hypothetical protein FOMPIDRAFT_1048208 [Fomitopsis schrenkii]|uniref:Uncharacterized protein n=1 Tax=Fomitopsis schrenkii TaxID=2126942 RepID=S8EC96_FOMSC|nr:hypothetical protein FOMPIDRAFT_1048208 [Fomitopsis schrenkii]
MSLRPTFAASKPYFSLSPETPTMQAVRHMKYPEIPPDSSVFEEAQDYLSQAHEGQPALGHATSATVDLPALLVAEGKYEEATRILDELQQQMHVQPRASQVFVDAALHVYRVAKPAGVQQQCSAFRRWYSLIPDAFSTRRLSYAYSRKVLDMLLGSPTLDLPLIEWYIRINVSRGYFLRGYAAIIRDFVRLSDRQSIVRLLDAVWYRSRRALDHVTRPHPKRITRRHKARHLAHAEYRRNQMLRVVYSAVIDELRMSNQTHEAMLMLQAARRRNIPVSTLVLSRLVPKLETMMDMEGLSLVKQLLEARPGDSQHTHAQEIESATPQAASLELGGLHEPSSLAAAVRVLRRHVHTPTCPVPSDLVHVIDACVRAGRLPLLALLRKKAYRTTSSAMQWTLAEMLFYSKQGDAPALSIVFGNSFRMVGVPRQSLHYAWFLRNGSPRTDFPSPNSPLQGLAMSSLPHVKRKIWPSAYHTEMVWHACVKETKRGGAVKKLYWELLAQVTAARAAERSFTCKPDHALSSASGPTRSLDATLASTKQPHAGPRGPSWMYRDAHFNIFIDALGKESPAAAARVMSDMHRLGIQPGEESMIALLRCFAAHNNLKMLLDLLTRMEATFVQQHPGDNGDLNGSTSGTDKPAANDLVLPAPNVAAYLVVIEHLVGIHRTEAASQVALRMLKNLDCRSGTDTAVDRVLRKLILLLSDPRRKHHEDGAAARLVEAIRLANEDATATVATGPSSHA